MLIIIFGLTLCGCISQPTIANKAQNALEESNRMADQALAEINAEREADKIRPQKYVDAHPDLLPATKDAIIHRQVFIGMTAEQAQASWGEPYSGVNKTITGSHTFEQWVYDVDRGDYLYFTDGILTSIQTH